MYNTDNSISSGADGTTRASESCSDAMGEGAGANSGMGSPATETVQLRARTAATRLLARTAPTWRLYS